MFFASPYQNVSETFHFYINLAKQCTINLVNLSRPDKPNSLPVINCPLLM